MNWGLFLGVVVLVFLLVVAIIPGLASPVPLMMFLLFGIVALYALFTYLVRRTLIVALGVVVLLSFVSHIQPYQMRFPGLSYNHEDILDLEDWISADVDRQAKFDEQFQRQVRHSLELQALAIRTGKVHVEHLPELARRPVELFLDIEGVPDRDGYYLAGLLVCSGGEAEYESFWADDATSEAAMWSALIERLAVFPDVSDKGHSRSP